MATYEIGFVSNNWFKGSRTIVWNTVVHRIQNQLLLPICIMNYYRQKLTWIIYPMSVNQFNKLYKPDMMHTFKQTIQQTVPQQRQTLHGSHKAGCFTPVQLFGHLHVLKHLLLGHQLIRWFF